MRRQVHFTLIRLVFACLASIQSYSADEVSYLGTFREGCPVPVVDGIGESDNTPIKNETVNALFSAWCSQVSHICERMPRRVVLFDLTAGCGKQRNGEPTFICHARETAGQHGLEIEILACEDDLASMQQLRDCTAIEFPLQGKWQDKREAIKRLAKGAYSFIYHDPNSSYQEEHRGIIDLAGQCPRADFCLHFDANQIKRIRCAGYSVHTLDELVVVREHCLIRRPFGNGSQWTVMYLSQCAMNSYSKFGFYKLGDSETGDAIWKRMAYTKRERKQLSGQRRFAFDY